MFSYFLDEYFLSYGEFKMRENKLRVKIPATAESSRSSGQSIILRYGTEGCPRTGTMQLWRRAEPLY